MCCKYFEKVALIGEKRPIERGPAPIMHWAKFSKFQAQFHLSMIPNWPNPLHDPAPKGAKAQSPTQAHRSISKISGSEGNFAILNPDKPLLCEDSLKRHGHSNLRASMVKRANRLQK
ncbi:hypothetical protein AKJ16_DCAP19710 [Drosera capensis]